MQCSNPGVIVYRGNSWECAHCSSISCAKATDEINQKDKFKIKGKICHCGALKTSNPNCHSTWCDLYEKR